MPLPALLVLASITEPITNWATNVVGDLGIPGIILLMVPESACIPIPSEATMLFAGFAVSEGKYSLFAAVAAGSLANLVGSWIAYAVGYYGRVELLQHSRFFHIDAKQIERADRWFDRYGIWAVFFSRMLPVVRTFISLPAGVARMPFWRFSIATLAGCIPWILMLTLIGKAAGDNWEHWQSRLHYVDYAIVALIVAAIVYFALRWRRSRREQREGVATDTA
jgi:membrane protein DedA with SNARE-associated domain